jgi:hypothetical protein
LVRNAECQHVMDDGEGLMGGSAARRFEQRRSWSEWVKPMAGRCYCGAIVAMKASSAAWSAVRYGVDDGSFVSVLTCRSRSP